MGAIFSPLTSVLQSGRRFLFSQCCKSSTIFSSLTSALQVFLPLFPSTLTAWQSILHFLKHLYLEPHQHTAGLSCSLGVSIP